MKDNRFLALLLTALFGAGSFAMIGPESPFVADALSASPSKKAEDYKPLPKAGQKCWIGDDTYFIYAFDKKPQLGTVILKIQVFTRAGQQDSTMEITGDSGMPSMRGAHDTGPQPFRLNKKGDFLLPVNIVMRGDWEVRVDFIREKKVIFMGRIRFDV